METFAACLLGLFAAGYFVLGGAGLGLGMLLRFLGRSGAERRQIRAVARRRFAAHQLWLLAAAVTLAGCFPALGGELLAGLWPVLAVTAAGWLARAAGRGEALVVAGSWVEAAGWSWLLASLLGGDPTRPACDPAAAFTTTAVVLLFLTHGLGFAARWLTGEPFQRARLLTGPRAGGRSVVLTSAVMAALPPLAGSRLPLPDGAAPAPVLALLLPPLLAAALWLLRRACPYPDSGGTS
jgi:cytochrome bd ubiquinol oxidase subunit II